MAGESFERAGERLAVFGHVLKNLRGLAAFVAQHPDVVRRFTMIAAVGEKSRRTREPYPYAVVPTFNGNYDSCRMTVVDYARESRGQEYGILVSEARIITVSEAETPEQGLHLL